MENKYRIVEVNAKFYVEVYCCETVGFWKWKRKVYTWERCNIHGGYFQTYQRPLDYFESYKDALKQIKIFMKPNKYYYPVGNPIK